MIAIFEVQQDGAEEEVRVESCYDYEDASIIESQQQKYLVGWYYDGDTVDIVPISVTDSNECDYEAGDPMQFSSSAAHELAESLAQTERHPQ